MAVFAAFVMLLSMDSTEAVPLLALLPALLMAPLFTLAAVRRSVFLRLAGLLLGALYKLAGMLVPLVGTFG